MTNEHSGRHTKKMRWIVFLNVILFVLIGFGFGQEYLRNREVEAEIVRMESENATLEADRLSSLSLIDTLSSAYYVEGEARQSGMGKEGEELIIIQDGMSETQIEIPVSYDDVPNPLRWYYYFFDRVQFDVLGSV
ncbi:MAG: septum formation initiator family protein [Patescibacteria group bacterium]|jgi:cell division protein FtsB